MNISRDLERTRFILPRGELRKKDEEFLCAVPTYDETEAKTDLQKISRMADLICANKNEDAIWYNIKSHDWSIHQKIVFEEVVKILDEAHLAVAVCTGNEAETIKRLVYIDLATMRMERLFLSIDLPVDIPQWLHGVLMDNLPPSYMSSYLEILQSLRNKDSELFPEMALENPQHKASTSIKYELTLNLEICCNTQLPKLGKDVVIVLLPTVAHEIVQPRSFEKWGMEFLKLGRVVEFEYEADEEEEAESEPESPFVEAELPYVEEVTTKIVQQACDMIQELRLSHPERSIVLVGFNQSAALAIQIASSEKVDCIICMGFASNTLNGPRGGPDDILVNIKTPILFVIGESAARTSPEHMELIRERMLAVTGLVVVGGADDKLLVDRHYLASKQVTQKIVDAMVLHEVRGFVDKMLTKPPGTRKCMDMALKGHERPRRSFFFK